MINYYFDKFLKYCAKYFQSGGRKVTHEKEYYEKQLNKIKKKLDKKGYSFWFDSKGNLMAYNVNKKEAKYTFLKKIKLPTKEKFVNIQINVIKKDLMKDETGGLELIISVERIKERENKIGSELFDDKNSLFRLYYKYDELKKFKFSELAKISQILFKTKLSSLKYYHYSDIKNFL